MDKAKVKRLIHDIYFNKDDSYEVRRLIQELNALIDKIPDDIVIAEGRVYDTTCEYSGGFHIGGDDYDIQEMFNKYDNKIIKLKLEVLE
jgi:hypothetical protein